MCNESTEVFQMCCEGGWQFEIPIFTLAWTPITYANKKYKIPSATKHSKKWKRIYLG